MKTSRTRPDGHPNDWPLHDYNAFTALLETAAARPEEHAIDRVTAAAIELGLRPDHWLAQATLAFVHGYLPVWNGLYYAEYVGAFLMNATAEDLRDREVVEWARELAGGSQH